MYIDLSDSDIFDMDIHTFPDVEEFMFSAGHLPDLPPEEQKPSVAVMALYYKLIIEEVMELQEAWHAFLLCPDNAKLAKVVDGLFDTIWVAKGMTLASAAPIHAVWKEGAQSNLAKIDANTGKLLKREDGKILKPTGWFPPDFLSVVLQTAANVVYDPTSEEFYNARMEAASHELKRTG